ncbi:transcriptional regulatory protein [Acrasis kona]|uniref:Transcriptional regulatory protein n=1 Tax=Acrasis kona TaxID=1008807 RepID=A0AAW2ZGN4_9EUKA
MTSLVSGGLAPHACSNCKNGHRRCDRVIPVCSYCNNRSKKKDNTCSYEESSFKDKQPRKKRKKDESPIVMPPQTSVYNNFAPPSAGNANTNDLTFHSFSPIQMPQQFQQPQFHLPQQIQSPQIQSPQIQSPQVNIYPQNIQGNIQGNTNHPFLPPVSGILDSSLSTFMNKKQTPAQPQLNSSIKREPQILKRSEVNQNTTNTFDQTYQTVKRSVLKDQILGMVNKILLIDPSRVEGVLTYADNVVADIPNPSDCLIPTNSELAFIFSLQAVLYKKMHALTLSHSCLQLAKKHTAKEFDGVLSSRLLSCSFLLIGSIYLEENDLDRAEFYCNNVQSYLQKCRLEYNNHPNAPFDANFEFFQQKMLGLILYQLLYVLKDSKNLAQFMKSLMLLHYYSTQSQKMVAYRFDPENYQKSQTKDNPDRFNEYSAVIQGDIDNNTDDFRLNSSVMENVCVKFVEHNKLGQDPKQQDLMETELKNVTIFMVAQAVKLQCLQREGRTNDPEMRKAADQLSSLTTTVCFNFAGTTVVQPVALCMRSHLYFYEKSRSVEDKSNLIDMLNIDLRALKVLSERCKFIPERYSNLLERVQAVINNHQQQATLVQLYASMRTYGMLLGEATCAGKTHYSNIAQNTVNGTSPVTNASPVPSSPSLHESSSSDSMLDLLYGGSFVPQSSPLVNANNDLLDNFFSNNREGFVDSTNDSANWFF